MGCEVKTLAEYFRHRCHVVVLARKGKGLLLQVVDDVANFVGKRTRMSVNGTLMSLCLFRYTLQPLDFLGGEAGGLGNLLGGHHVQGLELAGGVELVAFQLCSNLL